MATVLVVDDDEAVRLVLEEALNLEYHLVHQARDGQEGLAVATQLQPDLILLDLMMPVLDGWGFLRARQETPLLLATPVVVLTAAHLGPQEQERLTRLGAAASLRKPFELEPLLQLVARLSGAPS